MATIQNNIRWADNTVELKRNLMDGVNTVDAMKSSVDRLVNSMSGQGLFGQANKTAAAIMQMGGVTKLTGAEQERVNGILDKAIQKYKAMGIEAPSAIKALHEQTKTATQSTGELTTRMVALGSAFGTFIGTVAGNTVSRLGSMFTDAIGGAFRMNAQLETTTLKFTTLLKDSDKAAAHVKDLFEIAKKTPFETGPIIEASLKLQTFGGAALNTKANILLLGDASAATGAPINELGFWVGRMYAMLQGGKPFGEAAMRLQELAVMTPQARDKMEALQKSGASASDVFKVFQDSLGQFTGAMTTQAGTWEGVMSTFTDTVNIMMASVLKPYFEVIRDLGRKVNDALDVMSKSMDDVAASAASTKQAFADLITGGLNGTIKSIAFLMVEFDAAKVVFGDIRQVIDGVRLAFLLAQQAMALGLLPGTADLKRWKELDEQITNLGVSMIKRGEALQADKKAQQDWVTWGDKAVASVNDMAKSVGEASTVLAVHGTVTEQVATNAKAKAEADKLAKKEAREHAAEVQKLTEALEEVASAGDSWVETFNRMDVLTRNYGLKLLEQGISLEKIKVILGLTDVQAKALKNQYDFLSKSTDASTRAFDVHHRILGPLVARYSDLHGMIAGLDEVTGNLSATVLDLGMTSAPATIDALGKTGFTTAELRKQLHDLRLETETVGDALRSAFEKLPDTLMRAFEGGGGLLGAFKALGVQLAEALIRPIIARLTTALANFVLSSAGTGQYGALLSTAVGGGNLAAGAGTAGAGAGAAGGVAGAGAGMGAALGTTAGYAGIGLGAWLLGNYLGGLTENKYAGAAMGAGAGAATGALVGSVVPGVGTGIGAGVGAIVGAYAGWKAAGQMYEETKKQQADLMAQFGGMAGEIKAVSLAYAHMGKTGLDAQAALKAMWDARTPEEFANAVRPVAEALDKFQTDTVNIATGVDDVMKAGQGFGRQLPENMQVSIRKLMEMKGVTDEQKAALQGLLDNAKPNFEALTAKAAGFGITIEGLGPKFQQVSIEARSKELSDFLMDATAAGGDVGGMLEGLRDEISQLVNDSTKFGTAIPENMRPYIADLIRAGKLTDDNGDKIDDLTGIKFEDTPIDKSFDKLEKAIDHLSEVLNGVPSQIDKIGHAANDLPDNPFAGWKLPTESGGIIEGNPYGTVGGFVTARGIAPNFRMGGLVSSLMPRGGDTVPAMLMPGESVLTQQATATLGAQNILALNRGGEMGGQTVNTVIVVKPDGDDAASIFEALPYALKYNLRGIRTQIIQAIG